MADPRFKNLPAGKLASDFRTFDPGITTYNKEFMINCQVSQENFEKGKEVFSFCEENRGEYLYRGSENVKMLLKNAGNIYPLSELIY